MSVEPIDPGRGGRAGDADVLWVVVMPPVAGFARAAVVVDDQAAETGLYAVQNEVSESDHSDTRRRSDSTCCRWNIDDFGQGTWPAAGATRPRRNGTVSQVSFLERGRGSLSRLGGSLMLLGWSSAGYAGRLILRGDDRW